MSSFYPPSGGASALSCQRCRMPLPPNETYCQNCGYQNAPIQHRSGSLLSSWGKMPQILSRQGQDHYGAQQWGQPSPAAGQGQWPAPSSFSRIGGQGEPKQSGVNNGYGSPTPSFPERSSFNTPAPPSSAGGSFNTPASPFSQGGSFNTPVPPPSSGGYYASSGQLPNSSMGYGSSGQLANPGMGYASSGQLANSGMNYSPSSQFPNSGMGYGSSEQFVSSSSSGQHLGGNYGSSGLLHGTGSPLANAVSPLNKGPWSPSFAAKRQSREARPTESANRRFPTVFIVCLSILLIIIIGGSVFIASTLLKSNATSQSPATAPVASFPAPTTTPLFTDAFTGNKNGWYLQNDPGKMTSMIGGGTMTLEDDIHTQVYAKVPGNKSFGDFKLLADVMLAKGDVNSAYGFYIRGATNQNGNWSTYYRLSLYGDGTYAILKGVVDVNGNVTTTILVNYTPSPVIQPKVGDINHLLIIANGSSITLGVNGQNIKTITDGNYKSGSVGMFVSNLQDAQSGTQVQFSNFGIYPAQP